MRVRDGSGVQFFDDSWLVATRIEHVRKFATPISVPNPNAVTGKHWGTGNYIELLGNKASPPDGIDIRFHFAIDYRRDIASCSSSPRRAARAPSPMPLRQLPRADHA